MSTQLPAPTSSGLGGCKYGDECFESFSDFDIPELQSLLDPSAQKQSTDSLSSDQDATRGDSHIGTTQAKRLVRPSSVGSIQVGRSNVATHYKFSMLPAKQPVGRHINVSKSAVVEQQPEVDQAGNFRRSNGESTSPSSSITHTAPGTDDHDSMHQGDLLDGPQAEPTQETQHDVTRNSSDGTIKHVSDTRTICDENVACTSYREGQTIEHSASDPSTGSIKSHIETAGITPPRSKSVDKMQPPVIDFAPNNSRHRIQKVSPKNSRHDIPARHISTRTPDCSTSSTAVSVTPSASIEPTEEDLLLLLMYRARTREQEFSEVLDDHEKLVAMNEELRQDKLSLSDRLEETTLNLTEAQNNNQNMSDRLQVFAARYRKIKDWATDMNGEYTLLRQQGKKITQSLSELKQAGTEIHAAIPDLQRRTQDSSKTLTNLNDTVSETRRIAAGLSTRLEESESKRLSEHAKMRDVLSQQRKYEQQISHMNSMQVAHQQNIEFRENAMIPVLEDMNKRINTIGNVLKAPSTINECFEVVKTISQRQIASPTQVGEVKKSLTLLSESLNSVQNNLMSALQKASKGISASLDDESLNAIQGAISKIQPNIDELTTLREQRSQLQEKIKDLCAVNQAAEEQKRSAESRATGLQEVNAKLIGEMTRSDRVAHDTCNKTTSGLESQISELTVKWTLSAKAAKDGDAKLKVAEDKLIEFVKEAKRAEEKQTDIRDGILSDLNRKLADEISHHTATKQQLQFWISDANQKHRELDREQDIRAKTTKQLKECQAQLQDTRTDLQNIRSQADKVPGLENSISQLQTENRQIATLTKDLENAKADALNATHMTEMVNEKFVAAEKELHSIVNLRQEKKHVQQLLDTANEQLDQATKVAEIAERLKISQKEAESKLLTAEKHVEALSDDNKQIPVMKKANEELHMQITTLRTDLATARQIANRVHIMEATAHRKAEAITGLEQQIAALNNAMNDLNNVREESQLKDVEIAAMQARLSRLEGESQQIEQLREHIPDDVLDAFLSQDSILSLKSLILPDSQPNVSRATAETTDEDAATTDVYARKTADRSGSIDPRLTILERLSQPQRSVVVDSQMDHRDPVHDLHEDETQPPDSLSSPLSELDCSEESSDGESVRTSQRHLNHGKASLDDDSALYDLPQSPQDLSYHGRGGSTQSLARTSSRASQEDMLLQATPGRNKPGPVRISAAARSCDSQPTGLTSSKAGVGPSPRRLRSEQLRRSTPLPDTLPGARHQPNSAVKRSNDQEQLIDADSPNNKRRKRAPENLHTRSSANVKTSSGDHDRSTVTTDLPTGSRSGSILNTKAPAPGTNRKKNKLSQRSSRDDQYTARFEQQV